MYYRTIRVSPLVRIFLVFLVCLVLFQSIAAAAPTEGSEAYAEQGWVEVKATVPEGFKEDISVVLQAADGSSKTIFVLPENDYVGRLKVNCGTYDVMSAGVVNDIKMRYPSDWYPYLVEIKPDAKTAAAIKVSVANPGESYSPIIPSVSDPAASSAPDTSANPDVSTTPTTPSSSEPTVGDVSQAPAGDTSQEEIPDPAPEENGGFWKIVRDVGITLLYMAVFIGIVCAVVYFVRKREF